MKNVWMLLPKNKATLIDAENQHFFEQEKWYVSNHGYVVSVNSGARLQRAIMGCPANMTVDHKNGDKLDNRIENLRICTQQQNSMNRKSNKWKGVRCRLPGSSKGLIKKRWQAYIHYNGKFINLGHFDNSYDAALAYNLAAVQYFGRFANVNDLTICSLERH